MEQTTDFRFEMNAIVGNVLGTKGVVAVRASAHGKNEYYVRKDNGMGNWWPEHQLHEVQVIEHK
jgi:hypothetical protein